MRNLLLVILTLITVAASAQTDAKLRLVELADSAVARGDYPAADSLFTQALRINPSDPANCMLLANQGMIRMAMGMDSLAVVAVNAACAMAPESVRLRYMRARVFTSAGLTSEAINDYSAIIATDTLATEPRFYRAILLLRQGDTEQAESDIRHLPSGSPITFKARAALAEVRGDYRAAVAEITSLLRLEPCAEAFAERARLHLLAGNLAEAADDIASGLSLDAGEPMLYLLRADLNSRRYRPEDAEADMRKAVELQRMR